MNWHIPDFGSVLVWCSVCEKEVVVSLRPNNETSFDLCCDSCHYVICTMVRKKE